MNAYSSLPRDPDFYRKLPDMPAPHVENLKPSTMKRIGHAMWYYLMGWHYRHEFPRYRHHKSFSPWYEARCWVRAYWRKQLYKVTQRKVLPRLMNELCRCITIARFVTTAIITMCVTILMKSCTHFHVKHRKKVIW